MSAYAAIRVLPPRAKETSIRAGREEHFVVGHEPPEFGDLFAMSVLGVLIDALAVCRPVFGLCVDVQQDGSVPAVPTRMMNLGSKSEGMLEQLRRIHMGEPS